MSQVTDYTLPESPTTMVALVTALENIFAALGSCNRGSDPPDNPFTGMSWWDTSDTPTEVLRRYTVAKGWIELIRMNITTGAVEYVAESMPAQIDIDSTPASALTVGQISGTIITNNGQTDDIAIEFPEADETVSGMILLTDTVAKEFKITPHTGETWYLQGVELALNQSIIIASAVKGAAIEFHGVDGTFHWFAKNATVDCERFQGGWIAEI